MTAKKKSVWAVVCFFRAGAVHGVEYFSDLRIFSSEKKARHFVENVGNRIYDSCDIMQKEIE